MGVPAAVLRDAPSAANLAMDAPYAGFSWRLRVSNLSAAVRREKNLRSYVLVFLVPPTDF